MKNPIFSRPRGLRIGSVLALFCLLGSSAAEEKTAVSIVQTKTRVEIRVRTPSSLAAVLAQFCMVSNSRCEGLDHLSSEVVPALLITGTWSEVVDILMTGTGVNYLATQPGKEIPGQLILHPRSVAPSQIMAQSAVYTRETGANAHGGSTTSRDTVVQPSPSSLAGPSEPALFQQPAASPASNQAGSAGGALGESPFALGNGSTVNAAHGGPAGSPFSMGNGRPIPAFNPGEGGSPFSYQGKPIPATNPGQTTDTGPFPLHSSERNSPPR